MFVFIRNNLFARKIHLKYHACSVITKIKFSKICIGLWWLARIDSYQGKTNTQPLISIFHLIDVLCDDWYIQITMKTDILHRHTEFSSKCSKP